jgi:hypothetical protein
LCIGCTTDIEGNAACYGGNFCFGGAVNPVNCTSNADCLVGGSGYVCARAVNCGCPTTTHMCFSTQCGL